MCSDLGRWLRIAGYDTAIVNSALEDEEIFKMASYEKRLLLTKDKDFKRADPEGKTVIILKGASIDEWASELKECGVDWLFNPFSRCLECNCLLEQVSLSDHGLSEIPKDITELWRCPSCEHLFWMGSHTMRMKTKLREWKDHPRI